MTATNTDRIAAAEAAYNEALTQLNEAQILTPHNLNRINGLHTKVDRMSKNLRHARRGL